MLDKTTKHHIAIACCITMAMVAAALWFSHIEKRRDSDHPAASTDSAPAAQVDSSHDQADVPDAKQPKTGTKQQTHARLANLADHSDAQELLSTLVYTIIDRHNQFTYRQRYDATRNLHTVDLSDAEVTALLELLQRKDRAQARGSKRELAIRNDVLKHLIQRNPVPPRLAPVMLHILTDNAYHAIWHDYVVQFIPMHPVFTPHTTADNPLASNFIQAIHKLSKDSAIIRGTAMIALNRIADKTQNPRFRTQAINLAVDTLNHSETALPARITALQVARENPSHRILNIARTIADDPQQHYQLRMSAVAALRHSKEERDLQRCEQLANADPNKYVRNAARKTLAYKRGPVLP
jgi:hypothetical protein